MNFAIKGILNCHKKKIIPDVIPVKLFHICLLSIKVNHRFRQQPIKWRMTQFPFDRSCSCSKRSLEMVFIGAVILISQTRQKANLIKQTALQAWAMTMAGRDWTKCEAQRAGGVQVVAVVVYTIQVWSQKIFLCGVSCSPYFLRHSNCGFSSLFMTSSSQSWYYVN